MRMSRGMVGIWLTLAIEPWAIAADVRTDPPPPQASAGELTLDHGGIVRGPRRRKQLALIFTGGSFGEGAESILDHLAAAEVKASMFLTGDFLREPKHAPAVERMIREGHYVGAHSDAHPLYCSWDDRQRTLVSREQFRRDLKKNLADLVARGVPRERMKYFVPPYEWYNEQIARWAGEMGLVLVNYTPGTRSNADYLPDGHPRFISSEQILRGILQYEAEAPDGLNGFLLLLHLGVGAERTDKMHLLVGRLLDELVGRGYRFVRVDELLGAPSGGPRPACSAPSDRDGNLSK